VVWDCKVAEVCEESMSLSYGIRYVFEDYETTTDNEKFRGNLLFVYGL